MVRSNDTYFDYDSIFGGYLRSVYQVMRRKDSIRNLYASQWEGFHDYGNNYDDGYVDITSAIKLE